MRSTIDVKQVWSTPGRLWNILSVYLYETGTYLGVSGRNIPQVKQGKSVLFSYLTCFELRTENPHLAFNCRIERVGIA